jgi:NADPH:quinone reductase-like Zn-dependent oxidoreductase
MSRGYKILVSVLVVVGVAVVWLGIVLSHNGACGAAPALSGEGERMKTIVRRCYGSPDVLKLESAAKPLPGEREVLIMVRAVSLNPVDWHFMRGTPYLVRLLIGTGVPKDPRLAADFAGVVESVGKNVTRFKAGDEVFGRAASLAEFVILPEEGAIAPKPQNVSFEQAAAVGVAGVTALEAFRDRAQVQPGQKVLINGASGGVGTFAVQIAKALGAQVTGVCSTHNIDLVRSLGADHVIDYTKEDFTKGDQRYDVILDNVVNHSLWDYRKVLQPKGIDVNIGGGSTSDSPWIGAFIAPLKAMVEGPLVSPRFVTFYADLDQKDLTALGDLMASGKVTPVVDRRYSLEETPAAMRYLEQGHARGKIVIDVAQ